MTTEFSRLLQIDRIGREGRNEIVEANESERAALARRFDLPAIDALSCRFDLQVLGKERVSAQGLLSARVRQTCVATLEEIPAAILESFAIQFVPEDQLSESLDLDAPDEVPFVGGIIDLGEAAAEQLGLTLEPFPRSEDPDAPAEEEQAGLNPFAKLALLRKPS